jgi:hypothetical protein
MNRHIGLILGFAALALVATLASTATATSLIVNDGSFENLGYPPPDTTKLPATDTPFYTGYFDADQNWVSGNDFYNNETFGGQWAMVNGADGGVEWHPTAANFVAPIPDGSQVLVSCSNSTWPEPGFGGEIAVEQTLGQANSTLGFVQAHTTYTVTVAVGKILGQTFNGAYPGLADATAGAEIGNANLDRWYAPDGTFQDVSWSFNSDDVIGHGVSVGDQLAIFIDFGSGAVIDNVRVDATPEPSSLVLLAAGGLSLLAYGWRKRK